MTGSCQEELTGQAEPVMSVLLMCVCWEKRSTEKQECAYAHWIHLALTEPELDPN